MGIHADGIRKVVFTPLRQLFETVAPRALRTRVSFGPALRVARRRIMPTARGLVQKLTVDLTHSAACLHIGLTPGDVELLIVGRSNVNDEVGGMRSSMVDALAAAMAARREVLVDYEADSSVTRVVLK
jgi:hypothetical protein